MPTELKCDEIIKGVLPSDTVMDIDRMALKTEPVTLTCSIPRMNGKTLMRIMGFDVNPYPTKIIRSGDCTIVFWDDDTKTIVRKSADVSDDSLYTAFTAAFAIKTYGSNSKLKRIISKAYVEQKPRKGKKNGNDRGETDRAAEQG